MNLGKLGKKLQREIGRNKAKSAALGVMLVVAAYFWGPLVMDWTGMSSPAAGAATATSPAAVIASSIVTAPVPAATASVPGGLSWKLLLEGIKNDPRMASAELKQVDPFRLFVAEPEPEVVEAAPAEVEPEPATLAGAGIDIQQVLKLQSVFIGRVNRVASINGSLFRENSHLYLNAAAGAGGAISNTPSGDAGELELKLKEVHSNSVVISDGETSFVIPLNRPAIGKTESTFRSQQHVEDGNNDT